MRIWKYRKISNLLEKLEKSELHDGIEQQNSNENLDNEEIQKDESSQEDENNRSSQNEIDNEDIKKDQSFCETQSQIQTNYDEQSPCETQNQNSDENLDNEEIQKDESSQEDENNRSSQNEIDNEDIKKDQSFCETQSQIQTNYDEQSPCETQNQNSDENLDNEEIQKDEFSQEDENEKSNLQQRKELLQKLKDKLNEYKTKKEKLERESKTEEQDEVKNNFLESLKDLPSFEERDKGDGYSIDANDKKEVSEVIIKTLINKFLNQRFIRKSSDLNVRSNSLEETSGFYKWKIKEVITHLETEQYTKVLMDKYGYDYSNGKDEDVPLSFYFDLSGSMNLYSSLLAIIAIELLKKDVKVLVGFNENVHIQIESIDKSITVSELVKILENAGSYNFKELQNKMERKNKVKYKVINRDIDEYLIEKKAEKVVVFSDFDSVDEVVFLSNHAEVYYFCFEKNIGRYKLEKFNGFIYPVQDELDLERGLMKINEKRFKSLIYLDNPESIKRK